MLKDLRRHIMMHQGGVANLVGIYSTGGAYIELPITSYKEPEIEIIPRTSRTTSSANVAYFGTAALVYFGRRDSLTGAIVSFACCGPYGSYYNIAQGCITFNAQRIKCDKNKLYTYRGLRSSNGRSYFELYSNDTLVGTSSTGVSVASYVVTSARAVSRDNDIVCRIKIGEDWDLVPAEKNGEFGLLNLVDNVFYGNSAGVGEIVPVYDISQYL